MTGRRVGAGLVLVAVLATIWLVNASWTTAQTPAMAWSGACGHDKTARVIAHSSDILVFMEGSKKSGDERLDACSRSNGARVQLYDTYGTSASQPTVVTQISATGDYAGFLVKWFGIDTAETDAYVVDVATGDWVVDEPVTGCNAGSADWPCGSVQLVLGPAGSAAWLDTERDQSSDVVVSDGSGERSVEYRRGIEKGSLELHGSRLSWQDGAARRSALLHPEWDGRCMAADSVTVLSARFNRVYYSYRRPAVGYYDCLRSSGEVTPMLTGALLGSRAPHGASAVLSPIEQPGSDHNGIALARDYGAIANDGQPNSVLSLYNLRTAKLVFRTKVHNIGTLVVGRCGAMAWTQDNVPRYAANQRSTVYVYSDGRVRVVDRGLWAVRTDPHAGRDLTDDDTLNIVGHTLHWMHNGRHKAVPAC